MVKPNEKLKKIIKILGITGAVYLVFRYLLPLVIPFFIAGVLAVMLYPSAAVISRRIHFRFKNRKVHLPVCLAGMLELLLVLAVIGIWLFVGGQRLYREGKMLTHHIPIWLEKLDVLLTGACYQLEDILELRAGSLVYIARDMIRSLGHKVKDGIMPYLMSNSMSLGRGFVELAVMGIIMLLAVVLFLQEMPQIHSWSKTSIFRDELALIKSRLKQMGKIYIKAQGLILLMTTGICIAGLFLMGNPYSILVGILIGVMDALPVLGTGTIFIPWMLVSLFTKQWQQFIFLLIIYLVCYLMRQYMEAKLIGKQAGLSPLTTLVSLFVGLKLFGLAGVILGPVGLMLIQDFSKEKKEG